MQGGSVCRFLNLRCNCVNLRLDSVAIKILNAGAWARSSERVAVSLPTVVRSRFLFYSKRGSNTHL